MSVIDFLLISGKLNAKTLTRRGNINCEVLQYLLAYDLWMQICTPQKVAKTSKY